MCKSHLSHSHAHSKRTNKINSNITKDKAATDTHFGWTLLSEILVTALADAKHSPFLPPYSPLVPTITEGKPPSFTSLQSLLSHFRARSYVNTHFFLSSDIYYITVIKFQNCRRRGVKRAQSMYVLGSARAGIVTAGRQGRLDRDMG